MTVHYSRIIPKRNALHLSKSSFVVLYLQINLYLPVIHALYLFGRIEEVFGKSFIEILQKLHMLILRPKVTPAHFQFPFWSYDHAMGINVIVCPSFSKD